MKKLILFLSIFIISFQSYAASPKLEKARNAAVECETNFKKLDEDEKFQCLIKVTSYLELQQVVLQKQILNLQLNTTGY